MLNFFLAYLPPAILPGWKLKDSYVCDDQSLTGTLERDSYELEVRDESKWAQT